MTDWSEYQDDISDAISDSMDMDWSANDGARAVVRWLNENKPLSTTPRVTVPVEDLERVRDLLMERIHGSPARSPAHNARLEVEAMLSAALASGSGDHAELARLKAAMSKSNDEICQSLGKALGYPWFKDDQRNFPGATEENGVCVGEHVAESIADEAASRISALLAENAALREDRDQWRIWYRKASVEINAQDDRATEAERKLAEAVGHMSWMRNFVPTVWGSTEGRLSEIDDFLSKEAERGLPLPPAPGAEDE